MFFCFVIFRVFVVLESGDALFCLRFLDIFLGIFVFGFLFLDEFF